MFVFKNQIKENMIIGKYILTHTKNKIIINSSSISYLPVE
nr:MAG TPA: hypothetical protein [Caudoviricetes sp.]